MATPNYKARRKQPAKPKATKAETAAPQSPPPASQEEDSLSRVLRRIRTDRGWPDIRAYHGHCTSVLPETGNGKPLNEFVLRRIEKGEGGKLTSLATMYKIPLNLSDGEWAEVAVAWFERQLALAGESESAVYINAAATSVAADHISERGGADTHTAAVAELMSGFTPSQRALIARYLTRAKEHGSLFTALRSILDFGEDEGA